MGYLIALGAVIANVMASICLKTAVDGSSVTKSGASWIAASMPYGVSAIFYGLAFILYATSLKFLPLHVAQPLTSALPLVLIAIASVVVFREAISMVSALGLVLIAFGIFAVAIGARS